MTRRPRAILFDLDDTIISAYSNALAAWTAVATEMSGAIAPITPDEAAAAIQRYADEFWSDPERHRIWRQKLLESRREIVAGAISELVAAGRPAIPAEAGVAIADRFTAYREENLTLFPGAHETIDQMKAEGILLALVTNGAGPQQRLKVERFDLARRFDHIQIEGEHGFGKPEERAYLHAMQALGVTANETWMVGDNLEWEVAAPQRLGIYAIWHDHLGAGLPEGSTMKPDRIIRSLGELLPLPER